MDSRLKRVGGTRLVHLRYSDAPRVARAILDAFDRKATVYSGLSHDTPYVEFVHPNLYTVVVRGDDWKRIFPFLRYGSGRFTPVDPPGIKPPRIPSPQPNRDMEQPPVSPSGSLRSFLDHFDYFEYRKIQGLLTASRLSQEPRRSDQRSTGLGGSDWIPQPRHNDGIDVEVYNRLVDILQQLFPTDFPTKQG